MIRSFKNIVCEVALKSMILTLALGMFASCEHKELCMHHPHTAKVRVDVDWSKFEQEVPTGMTVMVYPVSGGKALRHITNTTSHAILDLEAGLYNTIVYNQTHTEFSSISFVGMDKYSTARLKANYATSRWYEKRSEYDNLVMEPEWVATDVQTDGLVTPQMVEATGKKELASLRGIDLKSADFVLASHQPLNIIHQIYVKVHLNGVYNLRSARASLSGLADSYLFCENRNTESRVTQLFENWSLAIDEDDPTKGAILGRIASIGLPCDHQGLAEENEFMLSLLMVDGKTIVDVPFNVGDLFKARYNEKGEFLLEYDIELWVDEPLPDVQPRDGGKGGFDVSVDDWGPVEDVPLDV